MKVIKTISCEEARRRRLVRKVERATNTATSNTTWYGWYDQDGRRVGKSFTNHITGHESPVDIIEED